MSYDPGAIVEVRTKYTVNDQECYNVVHYFADGSTAGEDIFAIQGAFGVYFGDAVDGRPVNEMIDMMSSDALVESVHVQQIYPNRYRSTVTPINLAGVQAVACDAQNVCGVIQKYGELANRKNIGSFHLGGLPNNAYTGGSLSATFLGELGAVAAALATTWTVPGLLGATYTPCILNKTKIVVDGKDKFIISGGTPVIGCTAKSTLRTMRRRTKGYGK